MKILLTGFEPFSDHKLNPSQVLVQSLPEQHQAVSLVKCILPVHHQQAPERVLYLLEKHKPDGVLAFGLAAGRAKISLERVAINLLDFAIPDNAGVQYSNQPIDPLGPAAYFSTLPLASLFSSLKNAGIPAEISLSAGAYLCNQVFYTLMHATSKQAQPIPAGFIHLPALPEQTAGSDHALPTMPLDQLLQAAYIILDELMQVIKA